MNGITRTIEFHTVDDHLVSASSAVAGFVPMQGIGRRDEQVLTLTSPIRGNVTVRFDIGAPHDPARLQGILSTDPIEAWSGVTFPDKTSWADLYLWFACYLPGFCRLAADDESELGRPGTWFPYGAVHRHALTYLVIRAAPNGAGAEFGVRAYGRDGAWAAATMIRQTRAWDRHDQTPPHFGYWPSGSKRANRPADAAVMIRRHGLVTISWPPRDSR